MKKDIEKLKQVNGKKVSEGYRIVYIHNNEFIISSYSKTIEGFINEIKDYNPYNLNEDNIEFTTIKDLLKEISIKYKENEIYIYDVNGNLIEKYIKKERKL